MKLIITLNICEDEFYPKRLNELVRKISVFIETLNDYFRKEISKRSHENKAFWEEFSVISIRSIIVEPTKPTPIQIDVQE